MNATHKRHPLAQAGDRAFKAPNPLFLDGTPGWGYECGNGFGRGRVYKCMVEGVSALEM